MIGNMPRIDREHPSRSFDDHHGTCRMIPRPRRDAIEPASRASSDGGGMRGQERARRVCRRRATRIFTVSYGSALATMWTPAASSSFTTAARECWSRRTSASNSASAWSDAYRSPAAREGRSLKPSLFTASEPRPRCATTRSPRARCKVEPASAKHRRHRERRPSGERER